MKMLMPNKKIFRIAIVFFVVAVLVYVLSIFLLFKKKAEIKTHSSLTFSALAQEEEALRIQNILDKNKEIVTYIRNFFIDKNDDISFIEDIEMVGNMNGVNYEIVSITPQKNKDDSKEEMLIKINFNGSWNSVIGYLLKLEKLEFGTNIQNMNIERSGGGRWEGFIEFLVYKNK